MRREWVIEHDQSKKLVHLPYLPSSTWLARPARTYPTRLLAALCDDEEYIRAKAAEALAEFADQNVADALEKLKFEDPSTRVKESASRAHSMVIQRIEEKEERVV